MTHHFISYLLSNTVNVTNEAFSLLLERNVDHNEDPFLTANFSSTN